MSSSNYDPYEHTKSKQCGCPDCVIVQHLAELLRPVFELVMETTTVTHEKRKAEYKLIKIGRGKKDARFFRGGMLWLRDDGEWLISAGYSHPEPNEEYQDSSDRWLRDSTWNGHMIIDSRGTFQCFTREELEQLVRKILENNVKKLQDQTSQLQENLSRISFVTAEPVTA